MKEITFIFYLNDRYAHMRNILLIFLVTLKCIYMYVVYEHTIYIYVDKYLNYLETKIK